MSNKGEKIIFLHIPKTGGKTLRSIFERQHKGENIYQLRPRKVTNKHFIGLEAAERDQIDLLMGHMRFGLHQYFSSPAKYVAMVRHPLDRVVSLYYFAKKRPLHRLNARIRNENWSLHDLVESTHGGDIHNGQTRIIAGQEGGHKKLLEVALNNIENDFLAVGLLERFDESLLLYQNVLDWKAPVYERQNVNSKRKPTAEINEATKQLILEKNPADLALYNYCQKKLNEQIAAIPDFEKRLQSFKAKNKRFQLRQKWLRKLGLVK